MKTKNQTTVIDYKNQEHIIPIWSIEDFYLDEPDMPIQTSLAYKLNNDLNNGCYIEIGAGHYKKQNNTYYLENKYNWTGISIDIEQPMVDIFNNNRKNKCIQADAITFNWEQYLLENNVHHIQNRHLAQELPNVYFLNDHHIEHIQLLYHNQYLILDKVDKFHLHKKPSLIKTY